MLIVLSPAKNLDFESPLPTRKKSKAALLNHSDELINQLKALSPNEISELMGISDKLGLLNYERFQQWQMPFPPECARPAIFAFKGDVYLGLDAYQFDLDDISFAQAHLRILSGLYGVLKPLDHILPYRLEMGTKLPNARGKDLYQFWDTRITKELNMSLKNAATPVVVNLASNEYFQAVNRRELAANIVTPVFKDWKNGQFKIISFFAKKARGRMSAYIIKNRISDVEQLKDFDWDGYRFDAAQSKEAEWVFTRKT